MVCSQGRQQACIIDPALFLLQDLVPLDDQELLQHEQVADAETKVHLGLDRYHYQVIPLADI